MPIALLRASFGRAIALALLVALTSFPAIAHHPGHENKSAANAVVVEAEAALAGTVHRLTIEDIAKATTDRFVTLHLDDGSEVALSGTLAEALDTGARVEIAGRLQGKAMVVERVIATTPAQPNTISLASPFEGTLALIHADDFAAGKARFMFEVHEDSGAIRALDLGWVPRSLGGGIRVQVTGQFAPDGRSITPDHIAIVGKPSGKAKASIAALAATPKSVLVIMANFNNTAAPAFTASQAQQVMTTNSNSVVNFYNEVSYGQQQLNVTTTAGWVTMNLASPATCENTVWQAIGTQAGIAAKAANPAHDPAGFALVVYVFPTVAACGWNGLAYIGSAQLSLAKGAWINGTGSFILGVIGHELGHNFGLLHAASLDCGATTVIAATGCTSSEYGDPFDIMGNNRAMHFASAQKRILGWLPAGTVANHTSGTATYTLNPIETAGAASYAVTVPAAAKRTYWIEYRQPGGVFDSSLSSYPNNGAQIRVASPFESICASCGDDTEFLDFTPATVPFTDGSLLVGQTYTDATSNISISVLSAVAGATGSLTIQVSSAAGSASTTAVTSSLNPSTIGASVTFTATITGTAPTGTVAFTDNGTSIAGCSAATVSASKATCTTSTLTVGSHSIVATYSGDAANAASTSPALTQTVNAGAGSINVALASNGGVASASSQYPLAGFAPSYTIDNIRTGAGWSNGGGWIDNTYGTFPDWLQVTFSGSKTINRVIVYSLQDNYLNPIEPTDTTTFSLYGLTSFTVEGWNGASWVTLATVSGNTLVKRTVTFAATATDRIRINVTGAGDGWSRITEVEAWTNGGSAPTTTVVASSLNPSTFGASVTFTATITGTAPTGTVAFTDNGTSIAGCSAATVSASKATCTTSTLTVGSHSIVATYSGDAANAASTSPALTQTVNAGAGSINVALASNGGVASASSQYPLAGFAPSYTIDNIRTGAGWSNGGGWIDNTYGTFPDWLQVTFSGSKTINRVIVYSLQDNYLNPIEPTDTTTFSLYGLTSFTVEGWNGASWVTLATVSGNTLVKRTVTFAATATDRIRINVTGAGDGWSRITEVEAWTNGGSAPTTTVVASSLNPSTFGTSVTFTATVTGTAPTGSVAFTDNGSAITGCSAATVSASKATCTTSTLTVGSHSIVATYSGDAANAASTSPALTQTVNAGAGSINVALASNGGVASASSQYPLAGFAPSYTIDNIRTGAGWSNGGGWIDNTYGTFPDWLQVTFSGSKTINRVIVYSLQDNYLNPIEPTDTTTFSLYGLTSFTVEGWNGASWVTLATVSGNTLVKRTVTFAATATDRIRINVTGAGDGWSRITEVEAWGN